jgi:hypothetical protein
MRSARARSGRDAARSGGEGGAGGAFLALGVSVAAGWRVAGRGRRLGPRAKPKTLDRVFRRDAFSIDFIACLTLFASSVRPVSSGLAASRLRDSQSRPHASICTSKPASITGISILAPGLPVIYTGSSAECIETAKQGQRWTHWDVASRLSAPQEIKAVELLVLVSFGAQSFPRKRESTPQTFGNMLPSDWIPPATAGQE